MNIKHFFEVYSPKNVWRKMWLSIANLPMLPGMRGKCLMMGGVNIKGTTWIYRNVTFDRVAPEHIHIGNRTTITEGGKILTHYLDTTKPGRHFRIGDVWIGDEVFIGAGVIICNSVKIGNGAIIGAGSVVTKDIPPYQVWAGNPAHFIRERAH